jgi:hypothetical protein
VSSLSVKIGADLARNEIRIGFVNLVSALLKKENVTKEDLIIMKNMVSNSGSYIDFDLISEELSK